MLHSPGRYTGHRGGNVGHPGGDSAGPWGGEIGRGCVPAPVTNFAQSHCEAVGLMGRYV